MKTKIKIKPNIEAEFWSVGDIAAYLQVSISTINRLRNDPNEKFPARYAFLSRPRFKRTEVFKWIESKIER